METCKSNMKSSKQAFVKRSAQLLHDPQHDKDGVDMEKSMLGESSANPLCFQEELHELSETSALRQIIRRESVR